MISLENSLTHSKRAFAVFNPFFLRILYQQRYQQILVLPLFFLVHRSEQQSGISGMTPRTKSCSWTRSISRSGCSRTSSCRWCSSPTRHDKEPRLPARMTHPVLRMSVSCPHQETRPAPHHSEESQGLATSSGFEEILMW